MYTYIYIQVLSLIIIIKKIFKKNKTIVVQNMYFHIWVYCSVIHLSIYTVARTYKVDKVDFYQ